MGRSLRWRHGWPSCARVPFPFPLPRREPGRAPRGALMDEPPGRRREGLRATRQPTACLYRRAAAFFAGLAAFFTGFAAFFAGFAAFFTGLAAFFAFFTGFAAFGAFFTGLAAFAAFFADLAAF